MRRRGLRRFILEFVFLAGVAAAVTVAELRPAGVIALMAVAWIVVALLEWTAWLDEPHYGRGLPPRYYVPQVALPPSRAVDQGGARYQVAPARVARPPVGRRPELEPDDAPTFERPAAEWEAAIGEWPVLDTSSEETMIAIPDEVEADSPSGIVPLPPVLGLEETVEHRFELEEEPVSPVEPEREGIDPLVAAGGIAAPPSGEQVALPAPAQAEPEPAEPEPAEPEPAEPEPAAPAPPPVPQGPVVRAPLPTPVRMEAPTQHRLDPLASSGRRRFLIFGGGGEEILIDVDDGPPPDRVLPVSVLEQAKAAQR